jgi:hypothetical protein
MCENMAVLAVDSEVFRGIFKFYPLGLVRLQAECNALEDMFAPHPAFVKVSGGLCTQGTVKRTIANPTLTIRSFMPVDSKVSARCYMSADRFAV